MKAPSERHLEDWIVDNRIRFGYLVPGDYDVPEEYRPIPRIEYADESYIEPFFHRLIGRQMRLPTGRPDLIGETQFSVFCIELKRGAITYEAVGQCLRYMHDLREVFYAVFTGAADLPDHEREQYTYHPSISIEVPPYPVGEICGMVVGDSLQDSNVPIVCATCNIAPVIYSYDGTGYQFEQIEVESKGSIHDYKEFGYGIIGDALRNVMRANSQHQKKWQARMNGYSEGLSQ